MTQVPQVPQQLNDGDDAFDEVSRPSISFKDQPFGFFYEGVVIDPPKKLQSRDFETGNLAYWDDGSPKMSVVFGIKVTACPDPEQVGTERSVWVAKGSNLYSAMAAGQRAGGGNVRRGGTIRVTFVSERPNEKNPKLNAIKQYEVIWREPDGFVEATPPAAAAAPAVAAPVSTAPPAMTKPPVAAAPAAAPAAVNGAGTPTEGMMLAQIQTLIRTGMSDAQIAGVPTVTAAGVDAAAVAAVRASMSTPA